MSARRHPTIPVAALLAVVAVGLALLTADRPSLRPAGEAHRRPYARLLAESADLGPARTDRVQLTAALNQPSEPVRLISWADARPGGSLARR